ncbi:bifunctional [glutamate--ammonia ligase]-adenylyl-L-tyrosine phosphorylase/[glutamate--ammonia-ligase] adenylyltransferase [Polaromonas sp. CG_9.11]|uniref:bifunctional [glutamate--ammonia ligase]-adenylyl-L-tyrosine phosphorylase/[glutamate--ammonia-ligase] adenylyltransferase n=1 Tax=Polaromonas sp. CG_9.11 TaxID=2787730 RepID=UPI0018CBB581|nr:bifunctional [glutamate--ammonia ligase]-adenylyl-L-tyrosine phosphorylase/[glutamate--ammonia-ligase] adenylyltransferase [Polaromonas sp. CG_9.11]MBG6076799.1 glutamate-ammonia-ligase adenylyltransferase [Polaromonas sp. CG_9.11]
MTDSSTGCAVTPAPAGPTPPDASPDASSYSRFVQRIRRRYAEQMPLLATGAPLRPAMQSALDALLSSGLDTGAALRVLRQLVLERLAVLDCSPHAPPLCGSLPPGGATAPAAWQSQFRGPGLQGDGPHALPLRGSLPPGGATAPAACATHDSQPGVPLQVVTRAMTELAELALDVAMQHSRAALDEQHGAPQATGGGPARMWVVGMGKLGARELNVSSDIDLIYVYDHDGDTAGRPDGRGQVSNHEYFARQVRAVFSLIGEATEHGFVFRVDLALRPNGNSGPAAVSLSALEEYFQAQGREWERFAWLKSRVVAPLECIGNGSAQALRGAVLPFVFRRYLDYSVFDALRVLHRQIREHAAKRCAGHPERANDVKMSRGGIREIEFTVQVLQVVRGGQFPELRTRSTLEALQRVAHAGLMPQDTADAMARAYEFLRRVEHRIQYLDDQQTHVLPTRDDDLAWIAATMGYANGCLFLHDLDTHRELVAGEFDILLGGQPECKGKGCRPGASPAQQLDDLLEQLPPDWPVLFRSRLAAWHQHPRILSLREDSRARLSRLVQRTAQWLMEGQVSEEAALRLIDWIEPLLRRESYLALLMERPSVHERLLGLLGAARWPARYLMQHPGVIDELASDELMHERFDAAAFSRDLQQRLASLRRTGEDDEETCLNLLRRAHHVEVFRTLARDVEGVLTVEQVADDLSALAEVILDITVQWCWQHLKNRHRETPCFGIIAYGKLGGKELGYGSDLDIVFVYDDDDERAPEVYASFVRKLINWLTLKTAEGDLYEIDTALRPNGNSGLLVTPFEAFANYQQRRGSNTAWTWEHQAMTRARCVVAPTLPAACGSLQECSPHAPPLRGSLPPEGALRLRPGEAGSAAPAGLESSAPTLPAACGSLPPEGALRLRPGEAGSAAPAGLESSAPTRAEGVVPPEGGPSAEPAPSLRQRFDEVRRAVITAPRDPRALSREIVEMRQKVRGAHPVRGGKFDVKHSVGGMVDAEFAVQFLVLSQAGQHPELVDNVGNIALLQRAETAGLLPDGVGQRAAIAYRELRRVQHRARLNEEPTQVTPPALQAEQGAIQALWDACFKSND